jgi:uncharacterized membrane-anchored protein
MPRARRTRWADATVGGDQRVPDATASFWVLKGLSTAMGEAASDFLVHAMVPQLAVVLGFVVFVGALLVQFRQRRYVPWAYWLAVGSVGVFGTMAADVVHVALGVPYPISTVLAAAVLVTVFVAWRRSEGTLSIHDVRSPRREAFYWAAVVSTFATGTALGDFTASGLHLGYWPSAVLFAVVITVPAVGYSLSRWNAVACFWAAYVVTRPLGASIADGLGKPRVVSGLGLGDGPVALVLAAAMVVIVAAVSVSWWAQDTGGQLA